MKKTITLLLAIIGLSTNAQTLIPTEDTAAVWSVWTNKYVFLGDSTFNGQDYKKVHVFVGDTVDTIDYDSLKYVGLFRQDTLGEIAYAIAKDSTIERLLFDLSANIGDTVTVSPIYGYYYMHYQYHFHQILEVTVVDIDSVQINGNYRKRLRLENLIGFGGEYWIEGVGSNAGIIQSGLLSTTVVDIGGPELICMEVNGITEYQYTPSFIRPWPHNTACFTRGYVSTDEYTLNPLITIYPNPVTDILRLDIEPNVEIKKIEFIDLSGKTVLKISNDFGEINVSELPKGIYSLMIESSNGLIVRKVIKL